VPGAKGCILDKNVDGLYAKEPRKHPDAEQIKDITAAGLIKTDLEDLVVGRVVVDLLANPVNLREVRIIAMHGATSKKRSPAKMPERLSGQNKHGTIFFDGTTAEQKRQEIMAIVSAQAHYRSLPWGGGQSRQGSC